MKTTHPATALAIFFLLLTHSGPTPAHSDISAAEAREMLQSGEDVILLDVRESYELCGSLQHIEDAVNLPWLAGDLELRHGELPAGAKIIAVCASGSRSNQAANFLDGEGFANVYDMLGGMSGWSWETEPCDLEPVVRVHGGVGTARINWTATSGVQDYDLLRGDVDGLVRFGDVVELGPVDCLANDSPYTYVSDATVPVPGAVLFYLARQKEGGFGHSSAREPRVPPPSTCD